MIKEHTQINDFWGENMGVVVKQMESDSEIRGKVYVHWKITFPICPSIMNSLRRKSRQFHSLSQIVYNFVGELKTVLRK